MTNKRDAFSCWGPWGFNWRYVVQVFILSLIRHYGKVKYITLFFDLYPCYPHFPTQTDTPVKHLVSVYISAKVCKNALVSNKRNCGQGTNILTNLTIFLLRQNVQVLYIGAIDGPNAFFILLSLYTKQKNILFFAFPSSSLRAF